VQHFWRKAKVDFPGDRSIKPNLAVRLENKSEKVNTPEPGTKRLAGIVTAPSSLGNVQIIAAINEEQQTNGKNKPAIP